MFVFFYKFYLSLNLIMKEYNVIKFILFILILIKVDYCFLNTFYFIIKCIFSLISLYSLDLQFSILTDKFKEYDCVLFKTFE